MKIRKAEEHEKKNYSGLYPLFGYVVGVPAVLAGVKTRYTVPVEGLFEGKDEPNYEAMLPEGLHLDGDMIHSVLGTTQRDLLDRLSAGLVECDKDCDCKVQTGPREIA